MIRSRLPRTLDTWLSNRGFNFLHKQDPHYLNDNEVFSAALELYADMQETGNTWEDSRSKHAIKRFIERERAHCVALPLGSWYSKGC